MQGKCGAQIGHKAEKNQQFRDGKKVKTERVGYSDTKIKEVEETQ